MFGTGEMLVIALVAIIVVDPRKLPDLMKSLGKALGEFKQMSGEFKRTIERETEAADFEKRRAEAEQKLFGDKKEGEAAGAPTTEKSGEESGSIAEDAQEQAAAAACKHGEPEPASGGASASQKPEPEAAKASGPGESAVDQAPRSAEAPSASAASTSSEPASSPSESMGGAAPATAGSGANASIPVETPQTPAHAGEPEAPAAASAGTAGPSEQHVEPAASGNFEVPQAATAAAESAKSGSGGAGTAPQALVNAEEAQGPTHADESMPSAAEPPAPSADSTASGTGETPSAPANVEEPQAPAHADEPQAPAKVEEAQTPAPADAAQAPANANEPAAPSLAEPAAAPADGGSTPPPPPPPTGDDAVGEGQAGRMSLFGHLQDLRKRLTRSAIAMVVGFLVCYAYAGQMLKILMQPMLNALKQSHFIYTVPTEAFFTEMKVAFVAGIFVVSPYIFYQIYQFVAPGLYAHERRWIAPIAFFSALCFTVGALFGYFVVFPFGFEFFASYSNDILTFTPKLDDYFDFVVKLLVAFGIVFELPLFLFFLARLGLVTYKGLRKKRKYAILGAFVMAAALTPPDAVSQTMMAVPLVLLYEVGIWLAYFFGKKKPQPQEEAPAA